MGCFLELLFEILIQGVLSLVMSVYLKVAHFWVPQKEISARTKFKIQNVITVISVLLVLSVVLGLVFLLPPDEKWNTVGKYMTWIPLSVIGVQILLGIFVLIAKAWRRRK